MPHSNTINLNRCMSGFVVLECVVLVYVGFLWDGWSSVKIVTPSIPKYSNILLDEIYHSITNLDMGRFVVLEYISSNIRLLYFGTEGTLIQICCTRMYPIQTSSSIRLLYFETEGVRTLK